MAKKDYTGPVVDYTGGFDQASAKKALSKSTVDRPKDMGTLEGLQGLLAAGGMIADPLDWINASIYAKQGDYKNAAMYGSGLGLLGTMKLGSKIKQAMKPMEAGVLKTNKQLKAYERESKALAREDLLSDASFKRYRNSAMEEADADIKYLSDKIEFYDFAKNVPGLDKSLKKGADTKLYKSWKKALKTVEDNKNYYNSKYFKQDYGRTVADRINKAQFTLGESGKGYAGAYTPITMLERASDKPMFAFGKNFINRNIFSGPSGVGKIEIAPEMLKFVKGNPFTVNDLSRKYSTGAHEIKHALQESMKRYRHSITKSLPTGTKNLHSKMKIMERMNIVPKDLHKNTWSRYVKQADKYNLSLKARRKAKNPSISGPASSQMEVSPWELHANYLTDPAEISARLTQYRLNPSKNSRYYNDLKAVFGEKANIAKIANKYWAAAPVGLMGMARKEFEE